MTPEMPDKGELRLDRRLIKIIGDRADRIRKLIDLGAPGIVLFNEVERLSACSRLLGGGRHRARQAEEEAVGHFNSSKPSFGLCATPGCWKECFEECEHDGLERCSGCHERLEAERRLQDEEMDEMDKEANGGA